MSLFYGCPSADIILAAQRLGSDCPYIGGFNRGMIRQYGRKIDVRRGQEGLEVNRRQEAIKHRISGYLVEMSHTSGAKSTVINTGLASFEINLRYDLTYWILQVILDGALLGGAIWMQTRFQVNMST